MIVLLVLILLALLVPGAIRATLGCLLLGAGFMVLLVLVVAGFG